MDTFLKGAGMKKRAFLCCLTALAVTGCAYSAADSGESEATDLIPDYVAVAVTEIAAETAPVSAGVPDESVGSIPAETVQSEQEPSAQTDITTETVTAPAGTEIWEETSVMTAENEITETAAVTSAAIPPSILTEEVSTVSQAQAEETALSETEAVTDDIADDLISRLENHIARSEYGMAVQLYEENTALLLNDERAADMADDILNHFSGIARLYYTNTAAHITKENTKGNDISTGYEGYDPQNGTIDPHALEYLLSEEEKTALERTVIAYSENENLMNIRVTISICGMTAVYPADDIILAQNAYTAAASDTAENILKRLENHIARFEYGKAVRLYEENIALCSSDGRFSAVTDELINYFSNKAKLYYTHAATHITKQNVLGYDASTGFEGYNAQNGTLDPHALEYLLSGEEKTVLERTVITCDDEGRVEKAEIDICGMTVLYPANDIRLS